MHNGIDEDAFFVKPASKKSHGSSRLAHRFCLRYLKWFKLDKRTMTPHSWTWIKDYGQFNTDTSLLLVTTSWTAT
jgi:hypothetical protein